MPARRRSLTAARPVLTLLSACAIAGAALPHPMLSGQTTQGTTEPAATASRPAPADVPDNPWDRRDLEIASRFAPIFYQGVVGSGRFDYITNFDFDGDWRGDNNWQNADDPRFPLNAYVYYAVSETASHYFIHYAAFHPRDYKGGEFTGSILSQVVRRGTQSSERVRQIPVANDVVLAHENDLEGCLVVAQKRGPRLEDAEVTIVETLAHNRYLKFQRDPTFAQDVGNFRREGQHPLIYIEPKGHGMEAYADQERPVPAESLASGRGPNGGDSKADDRAGGGLVGRVAGLVNGFNTVRKIVNLEGAERVLVYRFTGQAESPESVTGDIGYELLPTYSTWWTRARGGVNETYGEEVDYGTRAVRVATAGGRAATRSVKLGRLGSAIRGLEGAANKARPPWGWFDMTERDRPLGEWFLDPAATVGGHFRAAKIATAYLHQPFLGVIRAGRP
jgi:hypothetical protein